MKRIIYLLLTASIFIGMLSACQKTPESPIVVGKNQEAMLEKATDEQSGTKVMDLQLPNGNYTYSASAVDGRLIIEANAPIAIPKSGQIPMARVSVSGFSQEQVMGFFNYLFPNEKPICREDSSAQIMTQGELQEQIIFYKQLIAEGSFAEKSIFTSAEEVEAKIEELEKALNTAPAVKPEPVERISDGTMWKSKVGEIDGNEIAWEEAVYKLSSQTGDGTAFNVVTPLLLDGNTVASLGYWQSEGPAYSEEHAIVYDGLAIPDAAKGKLTIAYDEAKALCDGFFAAAGINDMVLRDTFIIDDNRFDDTVGPVADASNYAFCFSYAHSVNGTSVYTETGMTAIYGGEDQNALPWEYEKIYFYVDNMGIRRLRWSSPTITNEIISENAGVISFEDAKSIFEKMVSINYEPMLDMTYRVDALDMNMRLDINAVELTLVRIKEQHISGRTGIYTPAWIFYGNCMTQTQRLDKSWDTHYDGGYPYPLVKSPILVINAIDGSIIDLARGY